MNVREVLGPEGLASRIIDGFEARASQLDMAEALAAKIASGGVIAVEAPTGVGKTLAYLVAAIASGRRVTVSTNTRTLQDQILDKDLPLLQRVLAPIGVRLVRASADDPVIPAPREVRYSLMKGRSNYLCLDRLDRQGSQATFAFHSDRKQVEKIREWSRSTARGDQSELGDLKEGSPLWAELDARAETCTGTKCPRHEECFVVRMRKEAERASLVIVNHHLLFADLALRVEAAFSREGKSFGEVIPKSDVLILDEAHSLEEIACDHFGGSTSSRKLERLVQDIEAWAREGDLRSSAARLMSDLETAAASAGDVFASLPSTEGRIRVVERQAERGERDPSPFRAAHAALPKALAALEGLEAALDLEARADPSAESMARRTREIHDSLEFALSAKNPDYAYWAERRGHVASLGAAPIDVANVLRDHLFGVFGSVALTSATLTAGGDDECGYFLRSVGAPDETQALVLGSPFDYPRQAALYLPLDAPEPDQPESLETLVRISKDLVDLMGGGALFLSTSYRTMRALHGRLSRLVDYPSLMQGEAPKRELIRAFVERAPALLFATASFWEGVDIPGDPLRLVIIDRLPFGSPQDPLAQARSERLTARGQSAFSEYHLPRAILRLKQGFGRLVRGRADRGVVAILDRRVQTRGYGKNFLSALPGAVRIHDLDTLRAWLPDAGSIRNT